LRNCNFGFDIDAQSSAFQSMIVDGEQKRGFWLSINRAPPEIKQLSRHIGRLQTCMMTPDGKPRTLPRGGRDITVESPFVGNCTAALLPGNRLLTNSHCYFDQDLVRAGFTIVREARVNFNYTSKDDTGLVRTYLVSSNELAVDKDVDALVLQILGGDANGDLDGHIPMKMMSRVEPFQELRMIHHPAGDPQQYSTGTCQVHRRQTEISGDRSPFRHTCESTGGSSGSLIFDARTLAVVALHNQGGLQSAGDSFNGGHKIGHVEAMMQLGFTEVAPPTGGTAPDLSVSALTDALLIFDPTAKADALRAVVARFPNTDAAAKAETALARIAGAAGGARTAAASQALSDALLTVAPRARLKALKGVGSEFAGTDAAKKATEAVARLETELVEADTNTEAMTRLQEAKANGDVAALRALLADNKGSSFGLMVQIALFEAEAAEKAATAAANKALTDALLMASVDDKRRALERVTQQFSGQLAAQKAAQALAGLAAPVVPKPPKTTPPKPTMPAVAPPRTNTPAVTAPPRFGNGLPDPPRGAMEALLRTASGTLFEVMNSGVLYCGVDVGLMGYSVVEHTGEWVGYDIDLCRAIAAAVLNDPNAVEFLPLTAAEQFDALVSGQLDVIPRDIDGSLSWIGDDLVAFTAETLPDGVTLMVPRDLGVTSVWDLDGAAVCMSRDSGIESIIYNFFDTSGLVFEPKMATDTLEAYDMVASGTCDAAAGRQSELKAWMSDFGDKGNFVLVNEDLETLPLGPFVRSDDPQWFNVVTMVTDALFIGTELNITSQDADEYARQMANGRIDPGIDYIRGADFNLLDDFMFRAIFAVGNEHEMFQRHIGHIYD
jgi:ABC-type amino acid transport substrate-binding protein/V8-like Glu-specific endopeptidase